MNSINFFGLNSFSRYVNCALSYLPTFDDRANRVVGSLLSFGCAYKIWHDASICGQHAGWPKKVLYLGSATVFGGALVAFGAWNLWDICTNTPETVTTTALENPTIETVMECDDQQSHQTFRQTIEDVASKMGYQGKLPEYQTKIDNARLACFSPDKMDQPIASFKINCRLLGVLEGKGEDYNNSMVRGVLAHEIGHAMQPPMKNSWFGDEDAYFIEREGREIDADLGTCSHPFLARGLYDFLRSKTEDLVRIFDPHPPILDRIRSIKDACLCTIYRSLNPDIC